MPTVQATWENGLEFSVLQDGHRFTIDGSSEFGGRDLGPRPKNLLLSALAGCTGMDVVSILKKMKITDYTLTVEASGEYTQDHPKVFSSLSIRYLFRGDDLPRPKIERAVELSQEKYCGVSAMLRKTAEIGFEIVIEGRR
jgi:putative redox protein